MGDQRGLVCVHSNFAMTLASCSAMTEILIIENFCTMETQNKRSGNIAKC